MNFNNDDSDTEVEAVLNNIQRWSQKEEQAITRLIDINEKAREARETASRSRQPGGSSRGRAYIRRDREAADRNLYADYFAENPLYNDAMFRRRFRMSRSLFLRVVDVVKAHDDYLEQKRNALRRLGLSTLQKVTTVFRMLAYGTPADATDEYIKIGESTVINSLKRFCRVVVDIYEGEYLRTPTASDVARLLQIGEQRKFPDMLGSFDCMHWRWKNCPTPWAGQFSG